MELRMFLIVLHTRLRIKNHSQWVSMGRNHDYEAIDFLACRKKNICPSAVDLTLQVFFKLGFSF